MNRKDYNSVCEKMRLENNLLWPIPITLDINDELVDTLEINEEIALRDKEGFVIAILTIGDIWTPGTPGSRVGGLGGRRPPVKIYFFAATVRGIKYTLKSEETLLSKSRGLRVHDFPVRTDQKLQRSYIRNMESHAWKS